MLWRYKCCLLLLESQEVLLLMSVFKDMQGHAFVSEGCWFVWDFIAPSMFDGFTSVTSFSDY